jgi:hypothetical protein
VHQSVRLHIIDTSQLQTRFLATWVADLRVWTTEVRVSPIYFLSFSLQSVPSHPVGHAFLFSPQHVRVNNQPVLHLHYGEYHAA